MQAQPTKHPELPAPIAGFFAHQTTDAEVVARYFTEDGVVVDERQEHHGRAAIEAWNASANAKYKFTTEVLAAEAEGERLTVRAQVTGTFPGSPVELSFRFTLAGPLIGRLEIAP
jgi:ketosteroid isomerase-like protein